jgi:hypothetical protein
MGLRTAQRAASGVRLPKQNRLNINKQRDPRDDECRNASLLPIFVPCLQGYRQVDTWYFFQAARTAIPGSTAVSCK